MVVASIIARVAPRAAALTPVFLSVRCYSQGMRMYADCAGEIALSVTKIRGDVRDFKANQFPMEAQKIYIAMNEQFASGKPADVAPYVTSQMLSVLKNQMRDRPGVFRWKYIEQLERPSTQCVGYYKSADEMQVIAQITVKIRSKQSLQVVDKTGKVLTDKQQDLTEYIVLEKWTKKPDFKWRIAGKIEPESI